MPRPGAHGEKECQLKTYLLHPRDKARNVLHGHRILDRQPVALALNARLFGKRESESTISS